MIDWNSMHRSAVDAMEWHRALSAAVPRLFDENVPARSLGLTREIFELLIHDVDSEASGLFSPKSRLVSVIEMLKIRRHMFLAISQLQARSAAPAVACEGKFLLLFLDWNLADGASGVASGGFIGESNFPLCDYWIGCVLPEVEERDIIDRTALVSWIPKEFVARCQRGIDVNPEECLAWADVAAPLLNERLLRSMSL